MITWQDHKDFPVASVKKYFEHYRNNFLNFAYIRKQYDELTCFSFSDRPILKIN